MAKSRRRRDARTVIPRQSRTPLNDNTDDYEDDDGTLSTLSTLSEATLMAEHHNHQRGSLGTDLENIVDVIRGHAEVLSESRPSIRKAASEALWKILTRTYVVPDALDGLVETIVDGLLRGGIRKGNATEIKSACRCLGTLWITVGEEDGKAGWDRVKDALMKAGNAAAVECLALGCFLLDENVDDIEQVLGYCEGVITSHGKGQGTKVVESLKGWLLVATTLDSADVVRRVIRGKGHLGKALAHLAASQGVYPAARIATAEVLSFVLECDGDGSLDEENVSDADSESAVHMISDALRSIELGDQVKERVAKTDRQWRKQILQAASTDTSHTQTVRTGSTVLEANGIGDVMRLAAFRSMLQGGLQVHVRDNPLMHEVFTVTSSVDLSSGYQKASAGFRNAERNDRRRQRKVGLYKKRQSHYAQLEAWTVGESD